MTSVAILNNNATYNGWRNKETWLVNLWLNSDECYYNEMKSILQNFEESYEQAEELELYVRFIGGGVDGPSLASDLLATSLARVDWQEIIEANLD